MRYRLCWAALLPLALGTEAFAQLQQPLLQEWSLSAPTAAIASFPPPAGEPTGLAVTGYFEGAPQPVVDPLMGSQAAMGQQPPCADCPCPCCHCAPCECPQQPAPCLDCPHVSTLQPFWNIHIFGAVQANVLFSTARPVAPGIPLFLAPGSTEPDNTVDVFARPSNIGGIFTGPEIGGFRSGGMLWMFLYNDALIIDRYGILPVQAWGELKNEDWRFAAGLQFNVFNPLAPNMLTFSVLLASGDAGNNFPGQFRIERYLHPTDDSQWTIQAAITDPVATGVISNSPISQFITGAPAVRVTEDNGWPTLEGRVAYSVGELKQEGLEARRTIEAGASILGGQLRTAIPLAPNVVANTFALGADFRWRVSDRFGVMGEAFAGEGLGFFNGGVLQSVNAVTFDSIRTSGAWGEVYYYLTPCLHTHWGAGVDNPIDRDLAASQITRNQTVFGNLIWDITRQLRVGFEATWRETNYVLLRDNEGVGLHTQVQWAF
jgi:hypothetical protein